MTLQAAPSVSLSAGLARFDLASRTKGCLTGSRVAGKLGAIIALDTCQKVTDTHTAAEFRLQDGMPVLATWIDNFYVFTYSASQAVSIIEMCDQYLQNYWKLNLKPTSKLVTSSLGPACVPAPWKSTSTQDILGIIVSNTGQVDTAFAAAKSALWKPFLRTCDPKKA